MPPVVFELVSAYGTVGLSLGVPYVSNLQHIASLFQICTRTIFLSLAR
jgi:Trk-type K+ transport system membrane component